MALAATHMRFALELKDTFKVSHLDQYLSGTLYPDSRYTTGLSRETTHPKDWQENFDLTNDFRKGWFVHLLCDRAQGLTHREWFPEALVGVQGPGIESWVKLTALKILQDLDDALRFDVTSFLLALAYAENPQGESLEQIKKYNKVVTKTYTDPKTYNIDRALTMLLEVGVAENLVRKIKTQVREYQIQPAITEKIPYVHSHSVERAKSLMF